jgi:hypothetical protein
MEMKGMIDKRDLACNIGEEGGKTVKVAESRFTRDEEKELSLAGEQCWLQFIAFDVRLLCDSLPQAKFCCALDLRKLLSVALHERPWC